MNFIQLLWLLIAGHCLADTALQPDVMAKGKRRQEIDLSRVPKGQKPVNLRFFWMTHHAMIHGLIVCLITQNIYLGMAETILHWGIDYGKCENLYSPYGDQALHILTKVFYIIILLIGGVN